MAMRSNDERRTTSDERNGWHGQRAKAQPQRVVRAYGCRCHLRRGKIELWLNLVIFIVSLAAIVGSALYFSHRPALRAQIDATKTRAYSLSEQTQRLLADLEGDWRISLVFVEDEIDRDVLRQMNEVLDRYDSASEHLTVVRIDPTDPGALAQYEALLDRLRAVSPEEVDKYEHHLAVAIEEYRELSSFAELELNLAGAEQRVFRSGEPDAMRLGTVHQSFTLLARNSGQLLQVAEQALEQSETQPIPDYEMARDTLVAALTSAASELAEFSLAYREWMAQPGLSTQLRAYLARAGKRFDDKATDLQTRADPLIHLKPLELTRIGRELTRGEAAIITGPGRAGVIPAAQLLPRANLRRTREGGITFDQRFRGEQLLSSALRSLTVDQMPLIVFVHALPESMLTPRDQRLDLFGIASILHASQYDVREWSVIASEQPTPEEGQPTVWVIIPNPRTLHEIVSQTTFETPAEELELIETAQRLLDDGQSVLLSYYPSTLHRFNQPDPWLTLLNGWGVNVDTARILSTKELGQDGKESIARNVDVTEFGSEHPIALAANGQTMYLNLPVEVTVSPAETSGVTVTSLINLIPREEFWLEEEWTRRRDVAEEPDEPLLDRTVSFAVAAERRGQRLIVIGSVDWMLSAVADAIVQLGGGRVALERPGNLEFMQASVAWLAGMDELIANSPTSQQVARIGNLSVPALIVWWIIIVGAIPGACLFSGVGVWYVRRR